MPAGLRGDSWTTDGAIGLLRLGLPTGNNLPCAAFPVWTSEWPVTRIWQAICSQLHERGDESNAHASNCGVLLTFALTNEGGRVISVVASPFPKSTV